MPSQRPHIQPVAAAPWPADLTTWGMCTRLLITVPLLGLLCARLTWSAQCYRSLSQQDFPSCKLLSPSYALHWRADQAANNLTLGLDADMGFPTGWLGVGISEVGYMPGSDILVVHRQAAAAGAAAAAPGPWVVTDTYAEVHGPPKRDANQSAVLLGQPLQGQGHTVAIVSRPLRACDPQDRNILPGVEYPVIWAYGRTWPAKHQPNTRGTSKVTFLPLPPTPAAPITTPANTTPASTTTAAAANPVNAMAGPGPGQGVPTLSGTTAAAQDGVTGGEEATGPAAAVAAAAQTLSAEAARGGGGGDEPLLNVTVLMPGVEVPSNATTSYLCTHVVLPHDRKYHITRAMPIVNSSLLHHLLLYACSAPPPVMRDLYSCLSMDGTCQTITAGWAPGITSIEFPPEAGWPLGGPDSTYFALQAHYENPSGVTGVVDRSGFTLSYTPRLRPYDVGIFITGQTQLVIPPGVPQYSPQPNQCPGSCTARLTQPMRVLYHGLHAHQLGKTIITQVIRNGTELPPAAVRQYYSFDTQSLQRAVPGADIILPGDTLITTCTYDSTSRTNVTTFGEGTQNEMCFNLLTYYPRQRQVEVCMGLGGVNATLALCDALGPSVNTSKALQAAINRTTAAKSVAESPLGAMGVDVSASQLKADPSLAPYFASGRLVEMPPLDSLRYTPYGTQCPNLEYGTGRGLWGQGTAPLVQPPLQLYAQKSGGGSGATP